MTRIDVTVRGAGIFGLSIAWACLNRGARVRLIDPHGAGSGSSGGIVGALAPHVPETWNDKKAFQRDSLLMAPDFWAGVEAAGGVASGYSASGRLQPIADERALELARARSAGAAQHWQGRAIWEVIRAEGDWVPNAPTGFVIRDTLSAHLHPRRAVEALVAALGAGRVAVEPAGEDRGAVVWATGWRGLAALSQGRARPVGTGVKGQAALLGHAAPGVPQIFVDGLHIIPHLDGTVAIGSTSERDFDSATVTDSQCDALVERAVAALPILRGAPVLERWAGVRPRARSRAPMLGPWPGRVDHFVANGGFKIGFGMAPKVAEVMADLILEREDRIPQGFRVEASL